MIFASAPVDGRLDIAVRRGCQQQRQWERFGFFLVSE
jgi:hypothetical protein